MLLTWIKLSSKDVSAACLYWASFALCLPTRAGLRVLLTGFASIGLFVVDQQHPYP